MNSIVTTNDDDSAPNGIMLVAIAIQLGTPIRHAYLRSAGTTGALVFERAVEEGRGVAQRKCNKRLGPKSDIPRRRDPILIGASVLLRLGREDHNCGCGKNPMSPFWGMETPAGMEAVAP